MKATGTPLGALNALAARQVGIFTRAQAVQIGISERSIDRRLASREWERMHRGVYRIPLIVTSFQQRLVAAWLWAGSEAAVSHRAAAAMLELEGVSPGIVELITTQLGRRATTGVVLHRTDSLPRRDLVRFGCLPVTNATRTLLDLGSVVGRETVERALDDATRRGLTTVWRLQRRLEEAGGRGRRGAGTLRDLLAARQGCGSVESILERKLLRLLIAAGLPPPVVQYEVRVAGRLLARVDLAYPDQLLAIEADGYRYHSGRLSWQKDLARRNLLTNHGWIVLHYTWDDVRRRPVEVVDEVRSLLGQS